MPRYADIYSAGSAPTQAQPVEQGAAATRNTTPMPAASAQHAVTISWLGLLIALVLLRIVYEVSE